MPDKEPKILEMFCPNCNEKKEIPLTKENVASNNLGIWPFLHVGYVHCCLCGRTAEMRILEKTKG